MSSLEVLKARAEKLGKDAESLYKKADKKWEAYRRRMGKVAKAIRAGATTKDPLVDFVIVRHDVANPKIIRAYRAVERELKKAAGQMILLVIREELEISGMTLTGVRDRFLLGKLSETPGLIYDIDESRCECSISTEWFVDNCLKRHESIMPIPIGYTIAQVGTRLELREGAIWQSSSPCIKFEIVIGGVAISEWPDHQREQTQDEFQKFWDKVLTLKNAA